MLGPLRTKMTVICPICYFIYLSLIYTLISDIRFNLHATMATAANK